MDIVEFADDKTTARLRYVLEKQLYVKKKKKRFFTDSNVKRRD